MSSANASPFDFTAAVARHFADRPTLRAVVSQHLLQVLLEHLPYLASVQPPLESADPLTLDSPEPGMTWWATQPLLDAVLQAMAQGTPIAIEPLAGRDYKLGLTGPHRFPGSSSEWDTRALAGLSEPLNALIEALPRHFAQAQVAFWRSQGSAGVSRDRWFQLLLKQALLCNLPLQGLESEQQALVRGLLAGESEATAYAVQVQLSDGAQTFGLMRSSLLVIGEWDQRRVVLWCSPSSVVKAFDSLEAFAEALRGELAEDYRFEDMSWDRYPLEGDVFAQQVALVLDGLLERLGRVRYSQVEDGPGLERLFASLSDPAQGFYSGYFIDPQVEAPVPPGIANARDEDSFAYQQALFDLALDQLAADGRGALDAIQDLRTFARDRLAARMADLHQRSASASQALPGPDDILLKLAVTVGAPGGAGVGTGGGEPLDPVGSMTLTEFAIGNLSGLGNSTIIGGPQAASGTLPEWLDTEAARQLVGDADIGGAYPRYVAECLDDPAGKPERIRRFAREWRTTLLFSGLMTRLGGALSDAAVQCVTDYCRGHVNAQLPAVSLFPLAFERRPGATVEDRVAGMFVLFCAEPAVVLLYRPLYRNQALREFASLQALLEAIRDEPSLQRTVLEWMLPTARPIYDNGGFAEPHIRIIGSDPYISLERPAPAALAITLWRVDVDEKLYQANRDLLVELADLQSTSNVESRWALLMQGAWLLFDTATLFLRGPIASVAWLVQALESLESDLRAIVDGQAFDRSAAAVDLALTLGMAAGHLRSPGTAGEARAALPGNDAFEGPRPSAGSWRHEGVQVSQGKVGLEGALAQMADRQLDFSWRGVQGFNGLSADQQARLGAFRSATSLNGLTPLASGSGEATYRVGTQHYVTLGGDVYAVALLEEGVRIVGSDGAHGPWLVLEHGAWRVDTRLRLLGGMPRPTTKGNLKATFTRMSKLFDRLTVEANESAVSFTAKGDEVLRQQAQIETLKRLKRTEEEKEQRNERMIEQYAERIERLEKQAGQLRLAAISIVENGVRLNRKKMTLLEQMLEPKYGLAAEPGFRQSLSEERVALQSLLIAHNDFILNELWYLADFPAIKAMGRALGGQKLYEVSQAYQAFRQALARTVELQERMLVASAELDELLVAASPDLPIVVGEVDRTVAQIIDQRMFTTEELRFHHVLNLADLALHLDSRYGMSRLWRYKDDLSGSSLMNAANAHGESITANLGMLDRIGILQTAWDEYSAAIFNSKAVAAEGGALVEPAMLERYRQHVTLLKDDAGRRLIEAKDVVEGRAERVGPQAYRVSSETQHAIPARDNTIVIASESQEDGQTVLVVRDPLSNVVVQRFDLREGAWVERLAADREAEPEARQASESAEEAVQRGLRQNQRLLVRAQDYVDQDISGRMLARAFDRQIARFQALETGLSEQDSSARTLLADGLQALQADKDKYLTALYTRTAYPDAAALAFLHARQLIKVEYVGPRRTMADGSAFDEYKVMRLREAGDARGRALWAAHFHMPSMDASADEFTRGHLKLWAQRFDSNANLNASRHVVPGKRVHYGPLTLAEARGIIPF